MPIVGVKERDARTGAIVFERDDGSTFWSPPIPEAEKLAADLSARSTPKFDPSKVDEVVETSPRVAQAGGDMADVVRGFQQQAAERRSAPKLAHGQSQQSQFDFYDQLARPAETPTDAPNVRPATPPPGHAIAPSGPAAPDEASLASGILQRPKIHYGPSPAVTPEILQQKGGVQVGGPTSTAHILPTQGSVQVEGAKPPPPPEWLAEQERIFSERGEQVTDQRTAEERKLEMENAAVEQRASLIGDEMRAQEMALADLRARRAAMEQRLAEADDAVAEWKLDPNRIFKERGTVATIAAVVAQAIGAYGAALGGTPNFAMDMIQKAVDRDVDAQRQDFLARKDRANNLVARLNTVLGDLDAATLKAKEISLQAAQNYAEQLAVSTKREDIQLAAQDLKLKLDEARQAYKLNLLDRSAGNVTTKTAGKVGHPRAASAGGSRYMTDAEWAKDLAGKRKVADELALLTGAPTSEARQSEQKARAEARGKAQGEADVRGTAVELEPETLAKFHDDVRKLNEAKTELKQAEAILAKNTGASGKVNDIPGVGVWDRNFTMLRGEEARKNTMAAKRLVAAFVRATSGAAATDNERDYLYSALLGYTDEDFKSGVEFMRQQINQREVDLRASYSESGAVDAYDRGVAKVIRDARKTHGITGDGITTRGLHAIESSFEQWKAQRGTGGGTGIEQGLEK